MSQSGNLTFDGKRTRRGSVADKLRMRTPKRNLSSRDGDDDGADFQRAFDRIHRRALERATGGRLTAIGDRIIHN